MEGKLVTETEGCAVGREGQSWEEERGQVEEGEIRRGMGEDHGERSTRERVRSWG